MTKKELKLVAGEIIKESYEYSAPAKKQLFNFILKEANEIQLKSIILDQKIISEYSEKEINSRFELFCEQLMHPMMKRIILRKAGETIYKLYMGGVALSSLIAYGAYKIYRDYFSKAAKLCKDVENKEECIKTYRERAINMQIEELEKSKTLCSRSKDPSKCKERIDEEIGKLNERVKNVRMKLYGIKAGEKKLTKQDYEKEFEED